MWNKNDKVKQFSSAHLFLVFFEYFIFYEGCKEMEKCIVFFFNFAYLCQGFITTDLIPKKWDCILLNTRKMKKPFYVALRFHSYIAQKVENKYCYILWLIFLRQTITHTENYIGTANTFQMKWALPSKSHQSYWLTLAKK